MKRQIYFIIVFFLTTQLLFGQDIIKKVNRISTVSEANQFIKENVNSKLITVLSDDDALEINRRLLTKSIGDTILQDDYIYKIIEIENNLSSRVNYIYLDGKKYSMQKIDRLRNLIIERYKRGTVFLDLVKEYNMDGNPDGNLGWYKAGMVVSEFENEVRKHKKNDIFTIDVPSRKWYYVTIKTYDDTNLKWVTALKVNYKEKKQLFPREALPDSENSNLTISLKSDQDIEGIVVVEIIVDTDGNVIQATPIKKGSSTSNEKLFQMAKEGALNSKFEKVPKDVGEKKGKITFKFELN